VAESFGANGLADDTANRSERNWPDPATGPGKSLYWDLTLSALPNYVRDIFGSGKFAIALPQIGNSWDHFVVKTKTVCQAPVVRFLGQ